MNTETEKNSCLSQKEPKIKIKENSRQVQ